MGSVIEVDFKSKRRNDSLTAAMLASGLDTPPEVLALFYESIVDTAPCEMIPYHAPVDVSFTAQDYFAPESDPA